MLVKCNYDKGTHLPEDMFKFDTSYSKKSVFHLKINQNYVVYGMTIHLGHAWYYICDEAYLYYPAWNPAPLFEVIDGSISRYWVYSFERGKNINETQSLWAYPEWVNDPYYYDRLTDGFPEEVQVFRKYKQLMDVEFPDPAIIEKAQVGDEKWLICPICIDAWESISEDGMVTCPKCKKMMHNPRYKKVRGLPL